MLRSYVMSSLYRGVNSGPGTFTTGLFTDTTQSTSVSTGAVVINGGLGVAKNLYVGGSVNGGAASFTTGAFSDNVTISGSNKSLIFTNSAGGGAISWQISPFEVGVGNVGFVIRDTTNNVNRFFIDTGSARFTGVSVFANATTESTSAADGSLVVAGGAGIAKKLFVTGAATFASTVAVSNAITATLDGTASRLLKILNPNATAGRYSEIFFGKDNLDGPAAIRGGAVDLGTDHKSWLKFYTSGAVNSLVLALTLDEDQRASFSAAVAVGGATASSTTALMTPAGTTAFSSLRIPHGAAPSSPVDGDMWTTTAGLYVRVNGSTVGPLS